ncbi:MAG: AsmA-like C-terminal region-containing protein, partial [Janthinobacterium lividum]
VALDLVDGKIILHPLDFGVGTGTIASQVTLDANRDPPSVVASMAFRHLSLARIMKATHSFAGDGTIDGELKIDTVGNSMAAMMARGNGGMKLSMAGGGQLSALLVDIAGLEFGNALLSALGVPQKAQVQCFVADLSLSGGVAHTDVLLLQTSEARTTGKGDVDFRNETLDYSLDTRSTHFSIGSLPGAINITGPLKGPTILPGKEVAARAGLAVGLGILAGPAAILPTIQFGTGEGDACGEAKAEAAKPIVATAPAPVARHAPVRRQR